MGGCENTMLMGRWFATRTSEYSEARLEIPAEGDARLWVAESSDPVPLDLSAARISERLGSIPRRLQWPNGALLETADNDAVDAAMLQRGVAARTHWFSRVERGGWPLAGTVVGSLAVVALLFTLILPWSADRLAAAMPYGVLLAAESHALDVLDEMLAPTETSAEEEYHLNELTLELADAADITDLEVGVLAYDGNTIGANAFALPAGYIIVTDQLLDIAPSEDALAGVLAHELAHVEKRHGMRRIVRSALLAFLMTVIVQDVSQIGEVAATLPVVLMDTGYSREFEREADARAVEIMKAAGRDPEAYALMLERLDAECGEGGCGATVFSTHPDMGERIAAVRALAAD